MKLKKFAALALAGVMAVSMLAGCANKPAEEPTEKPTTTLSADLAAALGEDLKDVKGLTVVADAGLQSKLDAATKVAGVTATDVKGLMKKADTSLKDGPLPTVCGDADHVYKDDSTEATIFNVVASSDNAGLTVDYMINTVLVPAMKNEVVSKNGTTKLVGGLWEQSTTYWDVVNQSAEAFYFTYKYTLNVAVSTIENDVTGATSYVVAYTLTRTPTQVAGQAPQV